VTVKCSFSACVLLHAVCCVDDWQHHRLMKLYEMKTFRVDDIRLIEYVLTLSTINLSRLFI